METKALTELTAQGGHRSGRAQGTLITVVITCYNYAEFLRPCVQSVVKQTRPVDEIIIVDDGSTDESAVVAERCIAEFPHANLRLLRQANSGQPALARNAGIHQASGHYILPLDADDRIDPGYIEACCEVLEDKPETQLIYADATYVNNGVERYVPSGVFIVEAMKRVNQLPCCTFFKRELWCRIGGYRDNLRGYEDWCFWLACGLLQAKSVHLKRTGLIYNEKNSGVLSQTVAMHHQRVARLTLNNPAAYTTEELQAAARLLGAKGSDVIALHSPVAVSRYRKDRDILQGWRDTRGAWPGSDTPGASDRFLGALALAWRHRDWMLGAELARQWVDAFGADPFVLTLQAQCWQRTMRPDLAEAARQAASKWMPVLHPDHAATPINYGGPVQAAVDEFWSRMVRVGVAQIAPPRRDGGGAPLLAWALARLGRADLAEAVVGAWRRRRSGIGPAMADLMEAALVGMPRPDPVAGDMPPAATEDDFTADDVAAVVALAEEARTNRGNEELRGQLRDIGDECARRLTALAPQEIRAVFACNFGSIWEAASSAGVGLSVSPDKVGGGEPGSADWCRAVLLDWLHADMAKRDHAWDRSPLWVWESILATCTGEVRVRFESATAVSLAASGLVGKRVLIYTDDDTGQGGAAHYNHHLSIALRTAGAVVCVAQPRCPTPMLEEQVRAGIRHLWTGYGAGEAFFRSLTDEADAERIITLARPDLIYFSDCCAVSHLAAKRYAARSGYPYMIICHSEAAYLAERFNAYLPEVAQLLATAAEVVSVSENSRRVHRRYFGLADGRGQVIYNGRPSSYFMPVTPAERQRIRQQWGVTDATLVSLTAARFDNGKGYPFQVEALKRLRDAGALAGMQFIWVGEGELRGQIEALVAQEKLSAHVKFLGYRWDVPDLLAGADVFILPSLYESMPLCIIEAMARGVPVMGSAVGGIPEELGETGQLLPDPNLDAKETSRVMAQTLIAWGQDRAGLRERGHRAHERASALFQQEPMIGRFKNQLEEVFDIRS